jgi:hypothetical protein
MRNGQPNSSGSLIWSIVSANDALEPRGDARASNEGVEFDTAVPRQRNMPLIGTGPLEKSVIEPAEKKTHTGEVDDPMGAD